MEDDIKANYLNPNLDLLTNPYLVNHLAELGIEPYQLVQLSVLSFHEIGFMIYPDHLESMKGRIVDRNAKQDGAKFLLWLKNLQDKLQLISIGKKVVDQLLDESNRLINKYAKEVNLERSHGHFILKEFMVQSQLSGDQTKYDFYKNLYDKFDPANLMIGPLPLAEQQNIVSYIGMPLSNTGIISLPKEELTLFQKVACQLLWGNWKHQQDGAFTMEIATFDAEPLIQYDVEMFMHKIDITGNIYESVRMNTKK